jgi:hypothetical protein
MVSLVCEIDSFKFLDYLTEEIENIHEKEWMKTALKSHLLYYRREIKKHVEMNDGEAYEIVEKWFEKKKKEAIV